MPELPEVETICQGVKPYLQGAKITKVTIRQFSLRWRIADDLAAILSKQTVHEVYRRAKYLLLSCDRGTLIIHLGMSGKLTLLDASNQNKPAKHDHCDIQFNNGHLLRYNDPRRFGCILWTNDPATQHPLLKHLGPEPLTTQFDANYLWQQIQSRRCSIKTLIMNGSCVVGVGNIYANEALFIAKIHPQKLANTLSLNNCALLVSAIKTVLKQAIIAGGTTLKDFRNSNGEPGYFANKLNVYGKAGKTCPNCDSIIEHYKAAQRATFYCPSCQQN